MVFKSVMGALGVGGATVDAVLDTPAVQPGGQLTGTLHIRGGDSSQVAQRATIDLVARVTRKSGDHEYVSDEVITGAALPGPIYLGTYHTFPFQMTLPWHTPVTTLGGRNHVWLKSGLDVPWAMDPSDKDALQVHPNQAQNNVIQAMQQLGFRLYKVDIEGRSSWMGRKFVQEFEFKPAGYGSKFDEIEIVFENQQGWNVELLLQIDRAARGLGGFLAEMSGTDESWRRIWIDASSPQNCAMALQQAMY